MTSIVIREVGACVSLFFDLDGGRSCCGARKLAGVQKQKQRISP